MPWLALPYADRERKESLSSKFKVQGIPTVEILDGAKLLGQDGQQLGRGTAGHGLCHLLQCALVPTLPWFHSTARGVVFQEPEGEGACGAVRFLRQGAGFV